MYSAMLQVALDPPEVGHHHHNNIVWFYPERALQKAISKSTVKTVIALANKKQGQLYKVSRCRERKRFLCFSNNL